MEKWKRGEKVYIFIKLDFSNLDQVCEWKVFVVDYFQKFTWRIFFARQSFVIREKFGWGNIFTRSPGKVSDENYFQFVEFSLLKHPTKNFELNTIFIAKVFHFETFE